MAQTMVSILIVAGNFIQEWSIYKSIENVYHKYLKRTIIVTSLKTTYPNDGYLVVSGDFITIHISFKVCGT